MGVNYFQYGVLTANNSNSSPLTLTTSPYISANFMFGLKCFHVNTVASLKFTTTDGATTSVSVTNTFIGLVFSYWSFRQRSCPTGFPNFEPVS